MVQSTGDFLICFTRRYYFEQFVLQTVFIGAKKVQGISDDQAQRTRRTFLRSAFTGDS